MRDLWRLDLIIESLVALGWATYRLRRSNGGTTLLQALMRADEEQRGEPAVSLASLREARAAGRMVTRMALRLPGRPSCLPQALALRTMLRRRGLPCALRIGARLDGAAFRAHAWVVVGEAVVGGGIADLEGFRVLSRKPGR